MPNWNSRWLDLTDPLIQEVLTAQEVLRNTKAVTDRSGWTYGLPLDQSAEHREKEALSQQIEERMQRLENASHGVEKAIQHLEIHARHQVESAKKSALAAYYAVLDQHVEYWRLTGQLHPDYALPVPPEGEDGSTAQAYIEQPIARIPSFNVRSVG